MYIPKNTDIKANIKMLSFIERSSTGGQGAPSGVTHGGSAA
jgi:hypothetical protein